MILLTLLFLTSKYYTSYSECFSYIYIHVYISFILSAKKIIIYIYNFYPMAPVLQHYVDA